MKISIIAAMGKNRELGKDNKLLWHIPEDLDHFKKITTGHVVIMGRKTFESLEKPLPERTNIVITRDANYRLPPGKNVKLAASLEEAIEMGKQSESGELFVIGGGQIFAQALPLAGRLYLTIIDASFEADTFFPDYSSFGKVISEKDGRSQGYRYKFLIFER